VGQTDVTVTNTQTSPASFVSPTGEIRLRVRGSRTNNQSLTSSGDYVQFVVETSGSSISRAMPDDRALLAKLIPLALLPDDPADVRSFRGIARGIYLRSPDYDLNSKGRRALVMVP